MNYFEHFKNSKGNRDPYFYFVLGLFKNLPINILELGCARNLSLESRKGDGWSSFHFLDYISKYGGKQTIIDLDPYSIENCKNLLKTHPSYNDLGEKLNFKVENAINTLNNANEKFDLVYLDVGDDPGLSLKCFDLIDRKNAVIFIDDFHTKGKLIENKYPNYFNLTWKNNPHRMALYKTDMPYINMQISCIE